MSIRKILLLASMTLATVAFAVPSAAQADIRWYNSELEEFIPEEFHAELHAEGELTIKVPATGFSVGPCKVTFMGLAVNENAMASGTVTNVEAEPNCPTSVHKDCKASLTAAETPWEVTSRTKITEVSQGLEIKGVKITTSFNQKCQELGVPPQVSVAGTATPINCMPNCLFFTPHKDDMTLVGAGFAVDIEGLLTLTEPIVLM